MTEPSFTNHLISEKSPYLKQHAHNPIDWYPWGNEAFDAAKEADKPIFLSIGYATCHWCHVMEEESFQDEDVAKAMNHAFICIKVDREELPEVDSLYMEFAQTMIVGSAGWPLNLILTPDLKPFFAATYLPKHSSRGIVGVIELTERILSLWGGQERERLIGQADKIVEILRAHVPKESQPIPDFEVCMETAEILFKVADPLYGGMKGSPKFPLGYQADFLLRYFQKTEDVRALFLVEKTLEMMHRGGIFDHLGGGFHRYAVDEHWHIPHFEKMLYDNALLAFAYLDAWKVTHRPLYKEVCESVLNYVLRDMQHEGGGFYSAEDADSQNIEGLYYTWTRHEVLSKLGDEVGSFFSSLYGIFEHGMVEGRCVVRMGMSFQEFADARGMDAKELEEMMTTAKEILFKERQLRPRPFRDEKIVTSWNGSMLYALSQAGFYLGNQTYIDAAVSTARFIKEKLFKEERLYRRYCDGEVKFMASLDDYAFLIKALLSLFEVGCGTEWLSWAMELSDILEMHFQVESGGFCQSDQNVRHLLIRKCHYTDGAEPSGNAVHAENLIRLWQLTGKKEYLETAEGIFCAASRYIQGYPLGYCYHLIALLRYWDAKKATYVVCYNEQEEWKEEIEEALRKKSIGHSVVVRKRMDDTVLQSLYAYAPHQGKTTLYVCLEGVCHKPLLSLDEILRALQ